MKQKNSLSKRATGDVTYYDFHENRTGAQKAIEKANAKMSIQDNVQVIVPATEKEQGYTIVCSREAAKSKYGKFKTIELP